MSAIKKRIPQSYLAANWRNTTPVDGYYGEIGVAFDLPDGTATRLRLDIDHARRLVESLSDQLRAHAERVQSAKSSGMPNSDVSKPDDGPNV